MPVNASLNVSVNQNGSLQVHKVAKIAKAHVQAFNVAQKVNHAVGANHHASANINASANVSANASGNASANTNASVNASASTNLNALIANILAAAQAKAAHIVTKA